jgi:hypothetical protein
VAVVLLNGYLLVGDARVGGHWCEIHDKIILFLSIKSIKLFNISKQNMEKG